MATVRWLVEELGVPVDVVNVNGHSALHKCAIYGHGDVIAWLLSETKCNRAEHMGPDDRGSPPSALAAANGYDTLAAELRHLAANESCGARRHRLHLHAHLLAFIVPSRT